MSVVRPSAEEPVSTAVICGVAEIKDVEPTELDERLYDYVDPGALDRLFRSGQGSPDSPEQVSFTIAGCRVDIYGSRKVVVTTQPSPAAARGEVL